jgi:hypothetical protein
VLQDKRLLDQAPARFNANRADGRFLATLPANMWSIWKTSRRMRAAANAVKEEFERERLPPFLDYVRYKRSQLLDRLTVDELLTEFHQRRDYVLNDFGPASLKPGFFGGLALARLEGFLTQLMGPQDGPALASTLTRALEGDTTFEQDALLFEVAHGRASLSDFLARFGHRCVGEMELAEPRWRENSAYLEQTVARLRTAGRDPRQIHEENVARREVAEAAAFCASAFSRNWPRPACCCRIANQANITSCKVTSFCDWCSRNSHAAGSSPAAFIICGSMSWPTSPAIKNGCVPKFASAACVGNRSSGSTCPT